MNVGPWDFLRLCPGSRDACLATRLARATDVLVWGHDKTNSAFPSDSFRVLAIRRAAPAGASGKTGALSSAA